MIEITGCPGSGKSSLFPSNVDISTSQLFVCFPVVFFYLFFFHNNVFRYILFSSLCLKRSTKFKFAFFYHSFRKFLVYFTFRNKEVTVDEGLIHIAFNLELDSRKKVIGFLHSLQYFLKSTEIIIITCNKKSLFTRLSRRGHKRLATFENIENFIDRNKKVEYLLIQNIKPFVRSLRIINN